MEFTIKRGTFLNGIQRTLGIVEKKTTMPILSHILIRTEEGRIKVVATDRELGLIARYEAQVSSAGDMTISAKKLYEMVREIQGETILVKVNEQQVVLSAGKAVYRIHGLPADEFPQVVEVEDTPLYKISGQVLKDLISKTAFAVATDESRVNLCGVYFETEDSVNGPRLKMVATDGHRLAMACSQPGETGGLRLEKGVIIPRKGLMEIRKLVEDEEGDVEIGVDHGMIFVRSGDAVLKVSLIDADYPDYRRVMPSEKGAVLRFQKDSFLHALRRMHVVSSERYNGVILSLTTNKVVLSSTNPDVGEANDEIDVVYEGEEIRVGYNVTYMMDVIDVIDEEDVILELRAGMKPGMVRPAGTDDFICIVMPLKL